MFYRDHLPLVGEDMPVTAGYFEVGDDVIVEQEVDVVMSLQQGFGGWAEGMREVSMHLIVVLILIDTLLGAWYCWHCHSNR